MHVFIFSFAYLVSWWQRHERIPKLRSEPRFGRRELQSERNFER